MVKPILSASCFSIALLLCSCGGRQVHGEQSTTSTDAAETAKDVTVIGTVGEGSSMHVLQLCTGGEKKDTFNIMLDDNSKIDSDILIIGNTVKVIYARDADNNKVARSVTSNTDYDHAIGRWTMPGPIKKGERMGVELMAGGEAHSIRMSMLAYSSWQLGGRQGELILHGKSLGNGTAFDVTDTVTLRSQAGKWLMKVHRNGVEYIRD